MPLAMLSIGLESLNIALVWVMPNLFDYATKMLLSLAIMLKLAFCFVAVTVIGRDRPLLQKNLIVPCVLTNACVIAFSIITGSQMLMINNAVLLALLVVWSFLAVFEISWRWGKKE